MVAELFNQTLEFGSLINHMTLNFTGDIFLTLLFILAFFLLLATIFRVPILLGVIVVFPLIIIFSMVDWTGGMSMVLGVLALIVGVILAKSIFAYR